MKWNVRLLALIPGLSAATAAAPLPSREVVIDGRATDATRGLMASVARQEGDLPDCGRAFLQGRRPPETSVCAEV